MIRILHTADLHLDAPFRFLGDVGARHRAQVRATFQRVLALAAEYDLLLIAGDLFDTPRPPQATVDWALAALGRVPVPVCLLPGNHDLADERSPYLCDAWPPNVHLLLDEPSTLRFPALSLAVHGRPLASAATSLSPLDGLQPCADARWNLALAHGNLARPDLGEVTRPIRPQEIASCGMDYVALGDWHGLADYSQGPVRAWYSGAPEPTELGQRDTGYVVELTLDDSAGAQTRPLRVGQVQSELVALDGSGQSAGQLADALRALADPWRMLRVTIGGVAPLGEVLDLPQLEEELAPACYYWECVDERLPALSDEAIDGSAGPLLAEYVRRLRERIAVAATEEERRTAHAALQLGVALLQGRSV